MFIISLRRGGRLLLSVAILLTALAGVGFAAPSTTLPQAAPVPLPTKAQVQAYHLIPVNLSAAIAQAARQHHTYPMSAQPEGGTGGANAQIVPHLIDASSGLPVFAVSGFLPGETVNLFIDDVNAQSPFPADSNGMAALALTQAFIFSGQFWFKAVGSSSGRIAGDGIISAGGIGITTDAATVPHAVRPGDKLLLVGGGYPPNNQISARNGFNVIGAVGSGQYGIVAALITTNPNQSDSSEVFNLDLLGTNNTLGGSSVEERADAGPPTAPQADRAPAHAFVDRATGLTGGAYFALSGELFQPGETVRVTRMSNGSTITNLAADPYGSVLTTLTITTGLPEVIDLKLTGLSSGKQAWASVMWDDDGNNYPSALGVTSVAPPANSTAYISPKCPSAARWTSTSTMAVSSRPTATYTASSPPPTPPPPPCLIACICTVRCKTVTSSTLGRNGRAIPSAPPARPAPWAGGSTTRSARRGLLPPSSSLG